MDAPCGLGEPVEWASLWWNDVVLQFTFTVLPFTDDAKQMYETDAQ